MKRPSEETRRASSCPRGGGFGGEFALEKAETRTINEVLGCASTNIGVKAPAIPGGALAEVAPQAAKAARWGYCAGASGSECPARQGGTRGIVDRSTGARPCAMEHVIWLSNLTRQAKTLAYSLLAPETLGEGLHYGTVPDVGGGWATDLMAELDETRLESLVVVDIRKPDPEWFKRPETQEIIDRSARLGGADQWTERIALLLFEGDTYMVGFNLLRYGDDWKVYEQTSDIAGLHQSGAAWPVTASLFRERTSE